MSWHWLVTVWQEIRRIMGWDSGASFGYLFHSGSGATLELGLWGTAVYLWRSSCHERRWCLRHGRHDVPDPESGVVHRVCWKHAGLPGKYGARIREIQARHKLLYLGQQPGKG
jgi:hypothetical protein